MRKLMVCGLLLLLSNPAIAVDCEKHKVYCRIVELNPSVNRSYAFKLSNHIYKYANHYGIDPMLSVAIAAQENSFKNRTVEIISVRKETTCLNKKCKSQVYKKRIYDIGLYQINERTAKAYNCDVERLKVDIEYSVKCHFRILRSKMNQCKHLGEDSYSCYHSKTPEYREDYKEKVEKYLPKPENT